METQGLAENHTGRQLIGGCNGDQAGSLVKTIIFERDGDFHAGCGLVLGDSVVFAVCSKKCLRRDSLGRIVMQTKARRCYNPDLKSSRHLDNCSSSK